MLLLFCGWALYRLLVKKDLEQHKDVVYFGLFFFCIWGLIYWMMFL